MISPFYKPILPCLASGLLIALAAPGVIPLPAMGHAVFASIAWVPLLAWLLRSSPLQKQAFTAFTLMGLVGYGFWLSWLLGLHPLDWLGVPTFTSLILTAFTWLLPTLTGGLIFGLWGVWLNWLIQFLTRSRSTRSRSKNIASWIMFSVLGAAGLELLLAIAALSPFGFPWVRLAYAFSEVPNSLKLMTPLQAITHGHGFLAFSLLLSMSQIALALGVMRLRKKMLLVLISGWIAFLCVSLPNVLRANVPLSAALPLVRTVSGSMPPAHMQPDPIKAKKIDFWQPLQAPSSKSDLSTPTLWVFPEEGLLWETVSLDHPPRSRSTLAELQRLARETQRTLITGASVMQGGEIYNAILMLLPDGSVQTYHKRQLVPFGETFPEWLQVLQHALSSLGLALPELPGTYATGPPHQSALRLRFKSPSGKNQSFRFSGLICAEIMSPALLPSPDSEKFDALIVLANAGWFHMHSGVSQQMLAMARFRSAEAGKPLLLALNGGPSGWILSGSPEMIPTDRTLDKGSLRPATPLLLIEKTKDPLAKFKHLD